VFCNFSVDWILTNMVAVEQGSIGHLRFVMKHELQMIPLYGFYFHQHGCIYVKRGHFQPAKMLQSLRYLRNPKIPVSTLMQIEKFHSKSLISSPKNSYCSIKIKRFQIGYL
jgi:Acyltransferase